MTCPCPMPALRAEPRWDLDFAVLPSTYHPARWYVECRLPKFPTSAKPPESEKITINLGFVDLGQIELLVQEGFYSNRTDFIRTAIRNQIDRHADTVRNFVTRKSVELGLYHITSADLLAARAAGQQLDIRVLGLAVVAADVTPDLARDTIAALTVLGALQAPDPVRAALADRIT